MVVNTDAPSNNKVKMALTLDNWTVKEYIDVKQSLSLWDEVFSDYKLHKLLVTNKPIDMCLAILHAPPSSKGGRKEI